MERIMTERLALAKDTKGRVICVGDLITYPRYGDDEIYIVRLISGQEAQLEAMSSPDGLLCPITLQALSQFFEAVLCNACSKKLQVQLITVTNVQDEQVLINAPEQIRCNACKYRLLVERIAEQKHSQGEAP